MAGLIDKPEQLRAMIAHELCHSVLDHGWRGLILLYKPARFRAARELTCDNAGLVAAENPGETKTMIRKLCVGRHLYERLSDDALKSEARYIYSGFVGWLIRQQMTHPSAGKRLMNLEEFAPKAGIAS